MTTLYRYQAVDLDGRTVRGEVEAASCEAARQEVAQCQLYLLELRPAPRLLAALDALGGRRVPRALVIELANNLAIMQRAGLPILTSLADIAANCEERRLKGALQAIRREITLGSRFSDAVAAHPAIFPDLFIRLVRVGEETGNFEQSLFDVADHLQKMEDLAATVKRALIYPAFAIVATLGALFFWLLFVLPRIVTTMTGMGVKLPLLTRILIAASEMTQHHIVLLGALPLFIWGCYLALSRHRRARYRLDEIKLKLPIVKLFLTYKLLALFCEQMRILVMAGLTIDRTFDIIAEVIGHEVYRERVLQAKEAITYGSLISDALQGAGFPSLVVRMTGIGENSGSLDRQFHFLAEHYRKKLDALSDQLGKIIEPVVVGTIGLLFALIIMGLLLPVYDLVSKIGKG